MHKTMPKGTYPRVTSCSNMSLRIMIFSLIRAFGKLRTDCRTLFFALTCHEIKLRYKQQNVFLKWNGRCVGFLRENDMLYS